MRKTFKPLLCAGVVLALAGGLVWWGTRPSLRTSPAAVALADGRILQIEGLTYGTDHRIGNARSELLGRVGAWLPSRLLGWLEPKYPQSRIDHLDRPALVVWVNAINSTTRSNVDCQGIRVELVDEHGDLFGSGDTCWSGFGNFSRVGHVFYAFPRTERKLTMLVTPWNKSRTSRVEFANPFVVTQPAVWQGRGLPQEKRVGDLTITLADLKRTTNGSPKTEYFETRSVYWEPVWELRRGDKAVTGWEAPEWIAEDPTGNRSQHLGVHQPIVRFSAVFYPSPTNTEAAELIATLPTITLTNPQPAVWWNQDVHYRTNQIAVLGFFPPGNYTFSGGVLLTNLPVTMAGVIGGAPSGWTGETMMTTPLTRKEYHHHYSMRNSIIYLHAPALGAKARLAIRLRDEQGALRLTGLEPQETVDRIHPYLVKLPPGTQRLVAELVVLKPLEAEFTVKVPGVSGR